MAFFSRCFGVESLESRRLLAAFADMPMRDATHDSSYVDTQRSPIAVLADGGRPSVEQIDQAQTPAVIEDAVIDDIAVSIAAGNLAGARAAELRFEYASEWLDIDPASLSLGDAWRGRAALVRKVDDAAGTISVFIYSAQPMTISTGELLHFDVEVSNQLALDQPEALLELVKFELNEGAMSSAPTVSLQLSRGTAVDQTAGHTESTDLPGTSREVSQQSRPGISVMGLRPVTQSIRGDLELNEEQAVLSWQRIVSASSSINFAYPVQYVVHGLPTERARIETPNDLNASIGSDWWQRWQAWNAERRRWDVAFESAASTTSVASQPSSTMDHAINEAASVLHACLSWSQ